MIKLRIGIINRVGSSGGFSCLRLAFCMSFMVKISQGMYQGRTPLYTIVFWGEEDFQVPCNLINTKVHDLKLLFVGKIKSLVHIFITHNEIVFSQDMRQQIELTKNMCITAPFPD